MSIKPLNPTDLPKPIAPYSMGTRAGDTAYVSGVLALDNDGKTVGAGDVRDSIYDHRRASEVALRQLYRKSQLRPQQQLTFAPVATETLLRRVGIQRGMRVLDLGCGTGETCLLLAKLVGPSGLVVGIDPSAQAIDLAERRATIGGQCYWTRFVAADLDTFVLAEPFDALIVRLELF